MASLFAGISSWRPCELGLLVVCRMSSSILKCWLSKKHCSIKPTKVDFYHSKFVCFPMHRQTHKIKPRLARKLQIVISEWCYSLYCSVYIPYRVVRRTTPIWWPLMICQFVSCGVNRSTRRSALLVQQNTTHDRTIDALNQALVASGFFVHNRASHVECCNAVAIFQQCRA